MMKKIVITLLVLLLSSIVYADDVECPVPDYTRDCNAECLIEGDYESGRMEWYDDDCGDACHAEVKAEVANYEKCLVEKAKEEDEKPEDCTPPDYSRECKACLDRHEVEWYFSICWDECYGVATDPVLYSQWGDYQNCLDRSTLIGDEKVKEAKKAAEEKAEEKNAARTVPLIQVGAVAAVTGEVTVIRVDGSTEKLSSGKTINYNDRIITGSGRMQVLLLDETVFTIGPNTELVLDDFVYDPNTDMGKINANLVKGVFRFVTGKVARKQPSKMKIKLPGGWIGIRGTDGIVSYGGGVSSLHLHEGTVDITTDAGVKELSAIKSVTFDETGVTSEEDLTEDKWQTLIKGLELKEEGNFVYFFIPIFLLIGIIGLIVYFIVRKKIITEKTSKFAKSSLLRGFFSLMFGWMPFLGWVLIISTLVSGFRALKETQNLSGRNLAILGLIMGFISLILSIFVFINL